MRAELRSAMMEFGALFVMMEQQITWQMLYVPN